MRAPSKVNVMDYEDSEDRSETDVSSVHNSLNDRDIGPIAEDFDHYSDAEEDNMTVGFRTPIPTSAKLIPNITVGVSRAQIKMATAEDCKMCLTSSTPFYHVKTDTVIQLKESTKKLLCLLEELQSKTYSKDIVTDEPPILENIARPQQHAEKTVTDVIGAQAIRKLEYQTKELRAIVIEVATKKMNCIEYLMLSYLFNKYYKCQSDEDYDCSVYKRLTRKCHCLNQTEYNDFIIHFNEDTKFCTNTIGEIIKNMRILKRFLYMGGKYTRNALMFLNEGLNQATCSEKVEIVQAIAFADVCNVFDTHTIVTVCISWPCRSDCYAEPMTKELAATLLYKISQLEEGRRYLNFNSKIMCDIKKVIKKKASKIDFDSIECLNMVLESCLCHPRLPQQINLTYNCSPEEEEVGKKTLNSLSTYRQFMTTNEVFQYMDVLQNMSITSKGKFELTSHLPNMLILFRNMLIEYDDSALNIVVTNILNNIVAQPLLKDDNVPVIATDTATEPIKMKNAVNQIPPKKNPKKSTVKLTMGAAPNKSRQPSKRQVHKQLEHALQVKPATNYNLLSRSKKFTKDHRTSVIVVPIDKKENLMDKKENAIDIKPCK